MRVRYAKVDYSGYTAECDLTPATAKKLFNSLKKDGACKWAELVAEEDDEGEYMEILDFFDRTDEIDRIYRVMKELGFK